MCLPKRRAYLVPACRRGTPCGCPIAGPLDEKKAGSNSHRLHSFMEGYSITETMAAYANALGSINTSRGRVYYPGFFCLYARAFYTSSHRRIFSGMH